MKTRLLSFARTAAICCGFLSLVPASFGEAMLQYFNTSWNEIAGKMPELAEAGYDSLWLPPPTKGSGGLSVGYDCFDRFDLGSKDQRGSVSTRYGTEADLLNLITTAHRFGIRVYFDNIMNHCAFDIPGYDASTPIDLYPGFLPEDFHLRVTQDGFYRKWDNISDWSNTWQIQHRNFSDLIDIAQEPGATNENFGSSEGYTSPKIKFLRQPNNPEYYCYLPNGTYVGFGPDNGITTQMLAANSAFYSERVEDFLNRSARWLMDRTKADGLRLDAVKHVRADFFGATYGSDKDFNEYGYLGQAQKQFNLTRGFNDTKFNTVSSQTTAVNLRECVFDTEKPRHNAMMFGEHLGAPPALSDYFNAGMRLVNSNLQNNMNSILGNPSSTLLGLDSPGSYGFGGDDSGIGVMFAQSHDNDYYVRRELQHALYLTRAGLGNIYTDGNHQAQTLSQSGGAFPRHANSNFLGQWSDPKIPNLLYIHNQFARGYQVARKSDADFVAYERIDKRENGSMSDADGATMLFMMNDNYASGQGRSFNTSFAHTAGGTDDYLYNYSTFGGGFYKYASDIVNGTTLVPPGGYFVFSWKNPDPSDLWAGGGGKPITILQGGQPTSSLTYTRKDGPDGDPNFNPYSVTVTGSNTYSYPYTVPRITDASDLSFTARVDGSAENLLFELDGGVDLNGGGSSKDPVGKRDKPPGLSTDVFAGYEQPLFVDRIGPEKFAATNAVDSGTSRCTFGSAGAETYTGGGATVNGGGANPQDSAAATFVYHDPTAGFSGWNPSSGSAPATQYVDNGSTISVYAKTNSVGAGFRMFFYYTNDGSNPEGAGGTGLGTTKTVEMTYQAPNTTPGGDNWWGKASIAKPTGTIKYKIAIFKTAQSSILPAGATEVGRKKKMMSTFQVAHFNGNTAVFYPHNDFGQTQTGLSEGFHVIRARAFLNRSGKASIYNTFTQTFYYDALPPQGEVKFPAENDSVGGQQYGVVVRTDPSVTEVWYKIVDSDPANNDSATTVANGNGAWVQATQLTPSTNVTSTYTNEWRFNYVNIPSSGTGQILVRMRELSSLAMTAANAVNDTSADVANRWTTLVRNVNTNGPTIKMSVAFPQSDGQTVGSPYVLKVWFSKSLADNTTMAQLIQRFLIKIASSESGSPTNGVVQGQGGYSINYDVTSAYHELAYTLPNLYNGIPDFLHTITVTYTGTNNVTLTATRTVKAYPAVVIKNNIVTPPAFDSDGKVYQVVLPDVAAPTASQRTVPIVVTTDTNATNVAIAFTSGTGSTVLTGTSVSGSTLEWDFNWTGVQIGDYTFSSTVTTSSGTATATRDAHVIFRQIVTAPVKGDTDDDGLSDTIEGTPVPLPTTNSETWVNGDVHLFKITGLTDSTKPDSDGDDLADGLELGWATAIGDTNTATDTNGDGVKNFQPDLDPPIFNTKVDNANAPSGYDYFDPWPYNLNNSRTDQLAGTMTNPNKPDTDDDGVNDGVEDRTWAVTSGTGGTTYQMIHNGRVDIGVSGTNGVLTVISHPPTVYNTSKVDRSKVLAKAPNAVWLETDPNNADTDSDGIPDGQEDANHNGIVDLAIIDRNQTDAQGNFVVLATFSDFKQSVTVTGTAAGSTAQTFRYSDFCATFIEPTNSQSYTSTRLDKTKLNNIFRPAGALRTDKLDVIWLETDPRRFSTTDDGLPDGWKLQHGLDPYDDGVVGHYNLHTGKLIANTNNGPAGDPDNDGFTNLQEYINGTDPLVPDTGTPPPPGAITIGSGTSTVVGGVTNAHEFTDWTANDIIALDPYDGDGTNNQGSDIYHAYDGWDTSRDMVAFYAHDGGAVANGGDGKFYFRVDMHDLQAYAEQGNLDIYVAINVGNAGTGEFNLPDEVDTGTLMRWQAVVACYSSDNGRVYIDTDPLHNSTAIGQALTGTNGVISRDQNSVNGFKKAYYNSDLDAVEFSISRQALIDAGWNGINASDLLYQVFTTKDGTQDSPQGAGDIGGRSDIRDSIRNDWIASDYYQDQSKIAGGGSVLNQWIGVHADNDRGKRIKVVSLLHGNQAILPGNSIQSLINTGTGAGYYRPLDAHQAFGLPLTMHITPTLASAIQWAKVDPAVNKAWRDGPSLNTRIGSLISAGTIDLLGSTFSDHMMPYFTKQFNSDNVALANEFLTGIYGTAPSSKVFWTPERVSDAGTGLTDADGVGVMEKIADLGYQYTFIDQMRHMFKWFGRTPALNNDGYRINRVNGINCLVINDSLGGYLFQNTDNGLPTLLRQILNRKARDGQQDQVIVFMNDWENFTDKTKADAYDKNIRWIANHPWVQMVTPDQIANGQVDLSQPPDGTGDNFGVIDRGTNTLAKTAKDWIDHATEESGDNWYFGSAIEESLSSKVFNIRSGVPVANAYGQIGSAGSVMNNAWNSVQSLSGIYGTLSKLGRGTLHTSVFETAFHDQTANDLSKFSTGAYITPDTTFQSLSGFAKFAQSQSRMAAMYKRVDTWAANAQGGAYNTSANTESTDVDLDGENEYILYNDRIFAIFERMGGRLAAAWVRDIDNGKVFQAIGNPLSYSGSETQDEGNVHLDAATGQLAYRTSGFKDWFAQTGGAGVGTIQYVNEVYTVTSGTSGAFWKFTSSDGKIAKTITLAPRATQLQAQYALTGNVNTIYVRFGMSPNLYDLLLNGQKNLVTQNDNVNSEISVMNKSLQSTVRTFVKYGGGANGYNATYNSAATDRVTATSFDTIKMLNQAQTQQLEIQGGTSLKFSIGFQTGSTVSISTANDGIPDGWKQKYGLDINNNIANADPDGDGLTNLQEYILGADPTKPNASAVPFTISRTGGNYTLQFPTNLDRVYRIQWKNNLTDPTWSNITPDITGNGGSVTWTDDGTSTGSASSNVARRFYKVVVILNVTP